MNLKELSFPLRIYWDPTPAPSGTEFDFKEICEEIVELGVFGLSLLNVGGVLSNVCLNILEELKNQNISVALTASCSAVDTSTLGLLSGLKIGELLIDVSGEEDLASAAEIIRHRTNGNMTLGISFSRGKGNYQGLPHVLSFCLENDIDRLVFPMHRFPAEKGSSYITPEERGALSAKLQEIEMRNMKLTVHDPFLWRTFYPGVAFPGSGCQAANTMAYISPDARVLPCPSMPVELGDLRESALKTVLSSDYKKSVRKDLLEPPEECLGCGELKLCFGGCRGRTFAMTGSLSRRDPACFSFVN